MLPNFLYPLIFFHLYFSTVQGGGLYSKSSPVLQVTGKTYDKLIAQSPLLSIVEFYAPWCGHCQKLKPAFEKAATNLEGYANVAAVNCDDGPNKRLCGAMGVKGFPTLKIVKPSSNGGQPFVDDYRGARSAKAITDTVVDKIPNHVKRLDDKDLNAWLADNDGTAKAILFTDKWTPSTLYKVLAMEHKDRIHFAQIKDKTQNVLDKFGVSSFPTLVLLPSEDAAPQHYSGDLKKDGIMKFLLQATASGREGQSEDSKGTGKTDQHVSSEESSFSQASASHKSSEASEAAAGATSVTMDEDPIVAASPDPNVVDEDTPVQIQEEELSSSISTLKDENAFREACLEPQKRLCVLALLPEENSGDALSSATAALHGLAAAKSKYSQGQSNLFPIHALTFSNPAAPPLREAFNMNDNSDTQLVAVHFKKGWWKEYSGGDLSDGTIGTWIDAIRMGEGSKRPLPENFMQSEQTQSDNQGKTSRETSATETQPMEQKDSIIHGEL